MPAASSAGICSSEQNEQGVLRRCICIFAGCLWLWLRVEVQQAGFAVKEHTQIPAQIASIANSQCGCTTASHYLLQRVNH
jgi:hypothetical protein